MRASKLFFQTHKETPTEAEIKSHKLMLKAGLIKQQASGIYAYMPLGFRVLKKIENVIRQEMDSAGAQEVLMPGLAPQEVYEGRLDKFGKDMFKLKDRKNNDFCLTPTHEELFTSMVKDVVKSYKQLPQILYQFQTKYRDERRPRFGLQRSREFIMKDAYSFDIDEHTMHDSYIAMHNAYVKAFKKLSLDFVTVAADSGSMGGAMSEEFMVKSEVGEDTVIFCSKCGYSANAEKATTKLDKPENEQKKQLEKVSTPNLKTVQEVSTHLNVSAKKLVKTIIYMVDNKPLAVLIKGDREIQEVKLANYLDANNIRLATNEEVENICNSSVGYIGPVELNIEKLADNEVKNMVNFVTGSNEQDKHFTNVNLKDVNIQNYADIKTAQAGDICPKCENTLDVMKGIEVGHIFELGKTYSEPLGLNVLDENGKTKPVLMGSYGIGLGRTMAAIVEQLSDDKGIIWPEIVAPFSATIIAVNTKNQDQKIASESLYKDLKTAGLDVLIDDRKASFGARMKDSELLGIPFIIIAGKKADQGIFEFVDRKTGNKSEVTKADLIKTK